MRRPKRFLVSLVWLSDRVPGPSEPAQRSRGQPTTDADRLRMKALVIMIVRRLQTAYALRAFLHHPDSLLRQVRARLGEPGCFPSRRPWERRLAALPPGLPGLIGYVGRHWVTLLPPWARHGRAVAVERTALETGGGVWHTKPREQGLIPHRAIATAAGWSQSGWHGWWQGWQLHRAVTVGAVWSPLAAELTVANRGDQEGAPVWVTQLPGEVREVWGETHDNDPKWRPQCHRRGGELIATPRGPYPHREAGVEVRKGFHQLRSQALESFNGLSKHVFA